MSRKLMAMLVSSAMLFGSVSTSAWSATDISPVKTQAVQSADIPKNQSQLPAGGAAGIKQAQGFDNSTWIGIGLVAAVAVIAVILLDDDDDDDSVPSTGT